MAKREYSLEEQLEYYKKKASSGGSRKSAPRKKKGRATARRERKKSSGCFYEESYKAGPNSKFGSEGETVHRPKIWGWRRTKQHGFQSFTAYLSKDNGKPQNGTSPDICLNFVVNLTTEGVGTQKLSGVWSKKYRKLSMTNEQLVANPFAPNGGYFGRGGSHYKDKVK